MVGTGVKEPMRRARMHVLFLLILAVAGVLGVTGGCTSKLYDPIVRTHPKPGGLHYFRNFDPRACQIIVSPAEATNPVRTQHVLIATVLDGAGCPLPGQRVEWMLARGGVGEIVEVDESGILPSRGYKVDNYYAISYTNKFPQRLTRGTPDPGDDICLGPGQTWCVITSAIEGDTYVIAYAPSIYNWEAHKAFALKHWVDVKWEFPAPAVNPVGTQHTFTTRLTSISTGRPVQNYLVRYRLLDGPPATFVTPQEVHTDAEGLASVTIAQSQPVPGVNRVGIEIIRPRDGALVATGETSKTWAAPTVRIEKQGPSSGAVGTDLTYSLTVTNTGELEARDIQVVDILPPGMEYVSSDPAGTVQGGRVTWSLGSLSAGGSTAVSLVLRASQPGSFENCAQVLLAGKVQDESCVKTDLVTARLTVSKTGPTVATLGQTITYTITVANPSSIPATGVKLRDEFSAGLRHETGAGPVELDLGRLEPGDSKAVPIELTATTAGMQTNRVLVTADGGVRAAAEAQTLVVQPALEIDKTGPSLRYLNRPVQYTIVVRNPTQLRIPNVVVADSIPTELAFREASEGGQVRGNQVVWQLGTLEPSGSRQVSVTFVARQAAERVRNVAVATADFGLRVEDSHELTIQGVAGLLLEAFDVRDPLRVGEVGEYEVRVTNQGNAPANAVRITVSLPEGLEFVDAEPKQFQVEANRVRFAAIDGLMPQHSLMYRIRARATRPGVVILHVRLEAAEPALAAPVDEQEPTQVIAPEDGPSPAPALPAPEEEPGS
jgi:uncharacterized repeat protein (TIGR01451 family)